MSPTVASQYGSSPFLQVRGLTRTFHIGERQVPVLSAVDLDVAEGDVLTLTGASGAGKSTFLHLLGTLDEPDAGSLVIDGHDVTRMPAGELAAFRNRTVGFVFQFHHLLPELTAVENVALPARIARLPERNAENVAEEMLQRVGLGHRLDHKPSELSGGEQQRVAVARALVMRPRLLLADEPTGNLDERTSASIHDLLIELNASLKLTMIIATHNTAFAARGARRIMLKDGALHDGIYARGDVS